MEIPEIRTNIREIGIPDIRGTSSLIENPPLAVPIYPPVTTQVGVPIVNMPGCVEANKDSSDCLLYTSPSPRDISGSRMPSSA